MKEHPITYKDTWVPTDVSVETLNQQVDAVVDEYFGKMFKFRPHQKEAIIESLKQWLSGKSSNIIIDAPTGSGKSWICMIVAAVLVRFYDKKGYVLVSDLGLIDQYERDISAHFPTWSVLKGQQEYPCLRNGLSFKSGECKMKGAKSYAEIAMKYSCSKDCLYIQEREIAIKSPLVVCTYAFWLLHQNYVKPNSEGNPPFDSRDFVICDEAHKLVDIVNGNFSPKFGSDDLNKFALCARAAEPDDDTVKDVVHSVEIVRSVIANTEDNSRLLELLKEYTKKLTLFVDYADTIQRTIGEKKEGLSKEDRNLVHACEFINEHHSSFHDYIDIIEESGVQYLVKNQSDNGAIAFNCLNEAYLMQKFFHRHCAKKMYMSATIGAHSAFAAENSLPEFYGKRIPSTFDFTQSPIFYVDRYKMSFKDKDVSTPYIIQMISTIAEMYHDKRGIIQTGSYSLAQKLKEAAPKSVSSRFVLYDGAKEKKESIEFFKHYNNKILVGPTLIEGLSFDDDLCRFQIVAKVPYPSLTDKFVAAKMKLKPAWYSNATAISILQGVGRGVRNDHDWCVTFILDGCFTLLMQKSYNMFPPEFIQRISIIDPSILLKQN